MREKDIKRLVVKQLKKKFPNWRRLSRKKKKGLANEVLQEVVSGYTTEEAVRVPLHELLGTEAVPQSGIIPLKDMEKFIENMTRGVVSVSNLGSQIKLKDLELKAIDGLLDDRVINGLLSPEGYTPSKREIYLYHYLRAELLKCLRYPEVSYRKYCQETINKLENKTDRAFVHLPLHKKTKIDHSQLSQFRKGLQVSQLVNLTVYVTYQLIKSGKIGHPFSICGIDSSDIAAICNNVPLATVEIGKKKVRIYSELEADCGTRRRKRDKSAYFVGYRIHTLIAIDPKTGQNYPLFSLVAPGNHHDNQFTPLILAFSRAMGLEMKIITADEGYADADQNEAIRKEYGVNVITPADKQVKIPENVDKETKAVYMNEWCEIPMNYIGRVEKEHEFNCGDETRECLHAPNCKKYREIPLDTGIFGQIPEQVDGVQEVQGIRKHLERSYNLIKHRDGLEPLRVRSQHGTLVVATFAHITTLLSEIVGIRKTKKMEESNQQKLTA